MSVDAVVRERPWKAGLRGARANLVPGLVLQATALAVVLTYYHHAPTRAAFERLTAFRAHTGFAFGIVSTGFFRRSSAVSLPTFQSGFARPIRLASGALVDGILEL